jgi:serine protease AprX
MKNIILLITIFVFTATSSTAQNRYIITFKNKGGTPHTIASPSTYLSAKAIARRTKYNIAIDSTDLPITPRYLDSIRIVPGVTILNASKWLNQVSIFTTSPAALAQINSYPFVQNTNAIALKFVVGQLPFLTQPKNVITLSTPSEIAKTLDVNQTNILNYGNSLQQILIHNGDFLHDKGFLGNGMSIAMMDAGFNTYATNSGIDSLRINNQIKGTWDFVANEASVNEDDAHGFYCLSIIAANKPGVMIGSAPKANFYLYRTEEAATEYPIEEHNWSVAGELADSIGVDVFSTSLGYLDFDAPLQSATHSYAQRNGNTAMMTIAADLAAKKGILVCNSAGNNGNGSASFTDYKYVAVPADGDSVLAVGACNVNSQIASSSAWGPNSNGKIKPNVTSVGVGTSFINTGGSASNGNGTSFSNPNIAGLITGLWQAFPELSNMGIIDITQESAHLYNAPDGRYGYGIPNMKKAFVLGLKRVATQSPTIASCFVNVNFGAKDNGVSTYELQRKASNETNFTSLKNISATAGAFALKNYNFKDTLWNTVTGIVTYRIKHTMGTDTSFTYNEFTLNFNSPCATPVNTVDVYNIKIAPNPVKDVLTIQLGSLVSNNINIRITNANGAVVYNKKHGTQNNMSINTSRFAAGNYQVAVYDNKKLVVIKKLVKE